MKKVNLSELAMQVNRYRHCETLMRVLDPSSNAGDSEEYINAKKNKEDADDRISAMMDDLPSGSGIDNGIKILLDKCKDDKLFFKLGYHHMDEHGSYDGWTEHEVIVTPSFVGGFDLRVTGVNKNYIKEYLHDILNESFTITI